MTALDITANPGMNILNCGANLLTALDLTANPLMGTVHCFSNSLDAAAVDNVICTLAAGTVTGGILDITVNTAPTATGAACILTLEGTAPPWTVSHD
jgi:hypothetical protein